MDIDRDVIRKIVEEVVRQQVGSSGSAARSVEVPVASGRYGVFTSADDAVAAASESYKTWFSMNLETKAACVQAMRDVSLAQARPMAELAHAETGLGRVEDKVNKNLLQVAKTPGLEDVKPQVFTGDRGLTLVEKAPFGVICSVTPTTNPVATIINNSISLASATSTITTERVSTLSATALTGRFSLSRASMRMRARLGTSAPRHRRGRKALMGVSARSGALMGRIGP